MRVRKSRLFSVIALACFVLLTACAARQPSASAEPSRPLAGVEWKLVQVGDAPASGSSPDERAPFVQFDEQGQANGYSAVNNFSGTYVSDGSGLKFGPMIMTRRAGPPAAMALESSLVNALGNTRGYRIAGNTLELLDAGNKPLARFEAAR
ncbi:MAG TPA: META domain-containing protein [Methylophilaceae bacterium]|nr:META domain-containing protein [Methylophilaceae bacterium]HQR60252.1 META domain-containing protein [Methylophilaceae bacterium]